MVGPGFGVTGEGEASENGLVAQAPFDPHQLVVLADALGAGDRAGPDLPNARANGMFAARTRPIGKNLTPDKMTLRGGLMPSTTVF